MLALLAQRPRLIVMSATLEGQRVADHLGGTWLQGEGRTFGVEVIHPGDQPPRPSLDRLEERIRAALHRAPDDADVLIFLPGTAEIRRVVDRIRSGGDRVLPLHGGLGLDDQARVFQPSDRRKIIVATNVAETSLTVPGIRVVIDSGLVRRTRYHQGRGVLTLAPIAQDSADQRAGRAGRTAPGIALRLWRSEVPLQPSTPPAIHRESLVPLVLAAAAAGAPDLDLPWLDPPKDHAVHAARQTLRGLGALGADHSLTEIGDALFGLPLDPALGRLLIEARSADNAALLDAVDLVAALSGRRSLFSRGRPSDPDDDLRSALPWPGARLDGLDLGSDSGCDATALIRAMREGDPARHGLDPGALAAARRTAARLAAALGHRGSRSNRPPFDRRRLADLILAAWPGVAHVARVRRRQVAFSNGGTELELTRSSAIDPSEVEAILVLDVRAVARHRLESQLLCTAAMPVPLAWLRQAGLGRDRLVRPQIEGGQAVAVVERVYAGRTLSTDTTVPHGAMARAAILDLFLAGRIFDVHLARDRLAARSLWARLHDEAMPPPLEEWAASALEAAGVESGSDLLLLDPSDLLPDDLDPWDRDRLDRDFPRSLDLGDARYDLVYHPGRRLLVLDKVSGPRKALPPLRYVPKVPGWRIEVVDRGKRRVLRE